MSSEAPTKSTAPTNEVGVMSSPTVAPSEPRETSTAVIEQGKRFNALSQYEDAVDAFSKAVEILTEQFGELAPELIDVLILYGRALLKNAVQQSAVLGGGGTTGANTEGETGTTGAPSANPLAISSKSTLIETPSTSTNPNFHFGGDAEDELDANDFNDDVEQDEDDEDGLKETTEGAVQSSVEDDLETAWGILDSVRSVLEKEVKGEVVGLKLAGVFTSLAEVATESEKFEEAVTEYTSALALQTLYLQPYDRILAETHLMIALAYEYSTSDHHYVEALAHARKSKEVLVAKREQLEGVEGRTEADEAELKDLEAVIGELDNKIEDLIAAPEVEAQTEQDKRLDEALGHKLLPPTAPVHDLGSMGLVKKRKAPAVASESGSASGSGAASGSKENGAEQEGFGKRVKLTTEE